VEGSYYNEPVVVLVCKECEELTVLGGPLSVWLSGSTSFECGCGRRLTLADRYVPPIAS
jgi:hypothetical protein